MTNLKTRLEGRQEGFTLVELLIVVLIIGILAAIAIPVFNGQRNKAKNSKAQSTVRNALSAAKAYFTERETYAGLTLTTLRDNESSISATAPAGTVVAGATAANPSQVFVTAGGTAQAAPTGTTVVLCTASEGDVSYCVQDANGTVTYSKGATSLLALSQVATAASW